MRLLRVAELNQGSPTTPFIVALAVVVSMSLLGSRTEGRTVKGVADLDAIQATTGDLTVGEIAYDGAGTIIAIIDSGIKSTACVTFAKATRGIFPTIPF